MGYLYRHFSISGAVLYIGSTSHAERRMDCHMLSSPWASEIHRVELVPFPLLREARAAERLAISNENPLYNKIEYDGGMKNKSMETTIEKLADRLHPLVLEAAARCGGVGQLCRVIGVSRQAVSQWRDGVPKLRVFQLNQIIRDTSESKDKFAVIRRKSSIVVPKVDALNKPLPSSRFVGVSFIKTGGKKWKSQVGRIYLGVFETEEEASIARHEYLEKVKADKSAADRGGP